MSNITAGTNCSEVIKLINQIGTDYANVKEVISETFQTSIIDALKDNWYSAEGVYFMNSLGSTVYACTSQIAVSLNTVIYNIAGAYDYWVASTSGSADGTSQLGGTAEPIQTTEPETSQEGINGAGGFEPVPVTGDGSQAANDNMYYKTEGGTGGSGEYTYNFFSSEDTAVTLSVDGVLAVGEGNSVGINEENVRNVASGLSGLKETIATAISTMQTSLDASAALLDSQGGTQSQAVSTFYEAVMAQVTAMFDFMAGSDGSGSLESSINAVVEKYGKTIVTNISQELNNAAESNPSTPTS
ncbi:MAG: hypothetical protein ACI4XM_03930 [Candidatus Coprovivens sp.]